MRVYAERQADKSVAERLRLYWSLIKSPQTGLLLVTGLVGFLSAGLPLRGADWLLLGVAGSLFLTISGSTVLNMWYDRDIDTLMERTCWRPLPAGKISPNEALALGLALALTGVIGALVIDPLFGLIVFAGIFFDVLVYTIWLKRRTPWSIIWGGIAGGMPLLAGRALAVGQVDWIGLTLTAAILFWIPTHMLTFGMRYLEDYEAAGVPTVPARYGFRRTRIIIALSSVLAAAAMALAAGGIGLTAGYWAALLVVSGALFVLAAMSVIRPSARLNFGLFKYASLYMLSAMLIIVAGAL
ncbi:MAG: protoheme IX farnesyltransferase [Chloroflexi bacterium]|nr:protoheme IX farnesyltransferase [Chloroflexota bacterium]